MNRQQYLHAINYLKNVTLLILRFPRIPRESQLQSAVCSLQPAVKDKRMQGLLLLLVYN